MLWNRKGLACETSFSTLKAIGTVGQNGYGLQDYTEMSMEDGVGGQCFLAMENGVDNTAWHWQHTYLVESSAEMSVEYTRRLVTLTKKKQRCQSTVEAKRARREQERA